MNNKIIKMMEPILRLFVPKIVDKEQKFEIMTKLGYLAANTCKVCNFKCLLVQNITNVRH